MEGGGEVWMSGGKVGEDSLRGPQGMGGLEAGRIVRNRTVADWESEQCCPLAKYSRPKGVGEYNAAKAKVLQPS